MSSEEEKKVGLELLSDEVLARIVEDDIESNDSLKSPEAYAAFSELSRRSDNES